MSLLFETIRLQDGVLHNLEYHDFRLNQSRKVLFGFSNPIELEKNIHLPMDCKKGVYKCKVIYSQNVEKVTIEPYEPRIIRSLKLIEDNTIAYDFKYMDRDHLNNLSKKRGNHDDILIVKNGFITDTSFSNIIFYSGKQWITPATPLLQGTMRSFLLNNRFIVEQDIKATDLHKFEKARLINAMLPFEVGGDIQIKKINY